MVQSVTHAMAVITAYILTPSTWTDEILNYLSTRGYDVKRQDKIDLDVDNMGDELPNIILTVHSDACLKLRELLHQQGYGHHAKPMLVLITDQISEDFPIEAVDYILPPNARFIDHQLKILLQLRRENEQLQSETDSLRDNLYTQKKLGDKVEILKNAIVRNVSHELKTPLLQVKSAVSLLAEDVEDEELINYAKNATARLETLVKNITMLGSSLDMNPNPVIVRDAIESARRNLGRIWEHRHNATTERFKVILEPQLPPVLADKQGLITVLQLLIDNALKFSDEEIEIRAQRKNKEVIISVKDKGIGIAKNELEAIFESFYQVDSSSTRRYGGTGVGLAIVRLILENHDTEIHVESREKYGSTFSFRLPIVEV